MTERFTLKFTGDAVADHMIDVREYAPSLLGLATAMEGVEEAAFGNAGMRLEVQATNAGSFDVVLVLKELIDTLNADGVVAVVNATGLFTLFKGVLRLTRRIRAIGGIAEAALVTDSQDEVMLDRTRPYPEGVSAPGSRVKITGGDGSIIEVSGMEFLSYENGKFVTGMKQVVAPLADSAFSGIDIDADGADPVPLDKADARFILDRVQSQQILGESESEAWLEIKSAYFDRTSKWRFFDGTVEFNALVLDGDFLDRVLSGAQPIRARDSLHVKLRTTQRRPNANLMTDREIVKVFKHSHEPKPLLEDEASE